MGSHTKRTMAIVGGGPAGLFLARLLKLATDGWDITVFERDPADATYGFGIGLGPQALTPLEARDPQLVAALRDAGLAHTSRQRITLRGEEISWQWGDWSTLSVARTDLLSILRRQAAEVGVDIRFRTTVGLQDVAGADLVVAADGVNSAVRQSLADEFGSQWSLGHARFYWCAAPVSLPGAVFAFEETEHGAFTTHAYPFNGGMSGFMFETDLQTLQCAGLDTAAQGLAPGESDHVSRKYLEAAYRDVLEGTEIVTSNSRWAQFKVVTNQVWHARNVVLLGDSAHTAHPSIGSGTRMAMEDAIALSEALVAHDDLTTALEVYEKTRRPLVESLQGAAFASQRWWETFNRRLDKPLPVLGLHYATRTGRYGVQRMEEHDPQLVQAVREAYWNGIGDAAAHPVLAGFSLPGIDLPSRVLVAADGRGDRLYPEVPGEPGLPHRSAASFEVVGGVRTDAPAGPCVHHVQLSHTDPESAASDELVQELRAVPFSADAVLRLQSPADPEIREVFPGVMLADRLRHELGVPVCLAADLGDEADRDAVATALLTHRIDLVEHRPGRRATRR